MPIAFTCECGLDGVAPPEYAGRTIGCQRCGREIDLLHPRRAAFVPPAAVRRALPFRYRFCEGFIAVVITVSTVAMLALCFIVMLNRESAILVLPIIGGWLVLLFFCCLGLVVVDGMRQLRELNQRDAERT